LLAGIAAVVSYGHLHTLALEHGEGSWASALIPLSCDGMIVASSMALLSDSRLGGRGGVSPWAQLQIATLSVRPIANRRATGARRHRQPPPSGAVALL